jgi:hypothetical protein
MDRPTAMQSHVLPTMPRGHARNGETDRQFPALPACPGTERRIDSSPLCLHVQVVDPCKRATVDEIMAHPWFRADMPRELHAMLGTLHQRVGCGHCLPQVGLWQTVLRRWGWGVVVVAGSFSV